MFDEVKPGDLLVVSGKGPMSWGIQLGSLGLPNMGPLGRWGLAAPSHVAIAAPVFGELVAYEATSFTRPPCVRTGRENPKGCQAHYLSDIVNAGGDVFHYPLRRPLYLDEEDRLLAVLESCLGRGYDFLGAGRSGGGRLLRLIQRWTYDEDLSQLFCSELVMKAWYNVGVAQCRNAGAWNPTRLVRFARRRGIVGEGRLLT